MHCLFGVPIPADERRRLKNGQKRIPLGREGKRLNGKIGESFKEQ